MERPEAVSQQGDLLASIFIPSNCFRGKKKRERKEQADPGRFPCLLHLVTASHRVRKYLLRQTKPNFHQNGNTVGFFMGT